MRKSLKLLGSKVEQTVNFDFNFGSRIRFSDNGMAGSLVFYLKNYTVVSVTSMLLTDLGD